MLELYHFRTGPLINTWCMRLEAKNSFLKQAAKAGNFKNVPYTVAKRHQRFLCAYLQGDSFFELKTEYGPGKKHMHKTFVLKLIVILLSQRTSNTKQFS